VHTLHFSATAFKVDISERKIYKKSQLSHKENIMSEPVIADKKPAVINLEPGTYYWCSCGQSKNQPFCDGGHKGSEFAPLQFVVEEKKQVALCQCKYTGNAPFCDGAHSKL
jgi:CDGSH-type Zn-finger protein